MRHNYKQILFPTILLLAGTLAFVAPSAHAADCSTDPAVQSKQALLNEYHEKAQQAPDGSSLKKQYELQETRQRISYEQEMQRCVSAQGRREDSQVAQRLCQTKQDEYAAQNNGARMWDWSDRTNRCVNLSDPKQLSEYDECNNASLFTGELRGHKCKEALSAVKNVGARNSALSETTQAATTAYSTMQAQQTVGSQDEAQSRQKNIMQALAISKLATGGLALEGAMELKNAASGAESANSTLTARERELAQACQKAPDEQTCFYQNASKFGIRSDQATLDRMRRGAQQSQEQADAANQLAKTSLVTGLADTMVGLQALKMAQQAQQNATGMAVIPPPPVAPPVQGYRFAQSAPLQAGLGQSQPTGPTDYGNPSEGGMTLGDQKGGEIRGSMMGGRGYAASGFKPATSSVSGGGGGGGIGGGGLRGGNGGGRKPPGRTNTNGGEYAAGGGPTGFKGGGAGAEGAGVANPLADMLAKMFPQDKDGKPVVDTRNLASDGEPADIQSDEMVASAELSIFEQVSSKYRQLYGTGRF